MTKSINRGLTHSHLKERLHYDSLTGDWTWLIKCGNDRHTKAWNTRWAGHLAGSPDDDGHLCIRIDGIRYQAGPLSWFYYYGVWPDREVDHIDRDGDNNRIKNLRLTPHQQHNRDDTVIYIVNGKDIPFVKLWAKKHHPDVSYDCALKRYVDLGWNPVDACMGAVENHFTTVHNKDGSEILFVDFWKKHHHPSVSYNRAFVRFTHEGKDPFMACNKPIGKYVRL